MTLSRKPYPSDVSEEEWTLVASNMTLLPEAAGQREHPSREVFDSLRYIVKTAALALDARSRVQRLSSGSKPT